MFCALLAFAYLAACSAHAVLPLAHAVVPPVVPYSHGYSGQSLAHGYTSHGLFNQGYGAHHVLKRSSHFIPVGLGGIRHGASVGHRGVVGYLGTVGHVAAVVAPVPVAVSHQSRIDVHSSPTLVAPVLPIVKPVVASLIHAPAHQTPLVPLHYGGGYFGFPYSHLGHSKH